MPEVHYVKNENGDVHSVDDWHFQEYCHTEVRDNRYLRAGWSEITEEARHLNPQLFGARDRNITHTATEIQEMLAKRTLEAEMSKWDEADFPA